jgi:hypothetical protein
MTLSSRIVLNHSTHIEGLIDALARAGRLRASQIAAFVPGRLARTRGHAERLSLAVTVPVAGGHRVLARRGSLVQEVFVSTALGAGALQELLDESVPEPRVAARAARERERERRAAARGREGDGGGQR